MKKAISVLLLLLMALVPLASAEDMPAVENASASMRYEFSEFRSESEFYANAFSASF